MELHSSLVDEPPAGLAPADGVDDLFDEPLLEKFHVLGIVGPGRDVCPDRRPRGMEGNGLQGLLHPVGGRLHERRVEGAGDGQGRRPQPHLLGRGHRPLARPGVAGEHDLPRGVEVGADEDLALRRRVAHGGGLLLVGPGQGHHAAGRGLGRLLHELAAAGHQAQALGEVEHPPGAAPCTRRATGRRPLPAAGVPRARPSRGSSPPSTRRAPAGRRRSG